jgi:hypothetical protein
VPVTGPVGAKQGVTMSKRWRAALGAFLLVAMPAVQAAGIGKGDFEAGVSISVSETTTTIDSGFGECETTVETGTIGGTVGYFITDIIELKAAATATQFGTETCGGVGDIPSSTLGVFSPGADFVFLARDGGVAPFVGAAYGLSFGDTLGIDTDYLDVHGGAKFFIAERATLELKLTRFEPTESDASGRTELAAGINVYF